MSRKVHILKLYQQHSEFFNSFRNPKNYFIVLYCKVYNGQLREQIAEFNRENKYVPGPNYFKGLTFPRLKILMALLAQTDGITSMGNGLKNDLEYINIESTPERFRKKFLPIMVTGVWLLGTAIEDSLSDDPDVNCGNLFGFIDGDLGFWWAALVTLDWIKYCHEIPGEKDCDGDFLERRCDEFYNKSSPSRKYMYNQNSGMSSLDRTPTQFLSASDLINFNATINVLYHKSGKQSLREFKEHFKRITKEMQHLKI